MPPPPARLSLPRIGWIPDLIHFHRGGIEPGIALSLYFRRSVRTHIVPSMTIGFIGIRAIYCNLCLALKVRFSYNRYEMYAGTSAV
jgi:hypothetical protein